MPRRSTGPWPRKGRGYYVWHQNRQIPLRTTDEETAIRRWHRLLAGLPIEEPEADAVPLPSGPLLGDLIDDYLLQLQQRRGEAHYKGTKDRLEAVDRVLGDRPAEALTQADLDRLLAVNSVPRRIGDSKRLYAAWGPTRTANVLAALRGALRWASRPGGQLARNPLPMIDLPTRLARVDAPSADQVAALLAAARPSAEAILWALANCGARPGELRRATRDHCDADGAAIRLPTGKQGRRLILFPPSCRDRLVKLRRDAAPWMFPDPMGDQWKSDDLGHEVAAARERAGLPDWFVAYSLRHGWITARLRDGVPIATVARMAGTSVTQIDRTYGHLADQDLRAVADAL